jgi:phosphoglycolate phosphatase
VTEAVLFDIDGTLISSGGSSDRAWHRAFEELHGVDVEIAKVTGKGVPDPQVGRIAFEAVIGREPNEGELEALMARRLEHLPEEVAKSQGYRVEPGVVELLTNLKEDGILLGLTTGNVEAAALIKLARADLGRFFSFGGYSTDADDRTELTRVAVRRASKVAGHEIATDAIFSVGDTPRDVEAGHGAGIRVCGVATGDYSVEQLTEAGADWAIESLEQGLPV